MGFDLATTADDRRVAPEATVSSLAVLAFTDIVDSARLKSQLGDAAAARLITSHDELIRRLVAAISGSKILADTGDGFFIRFLTPSDAVSFSLKLQFELHRGQWSNGAISVRVGIHLGEVAELEMQTAGSPKLCGLAADVTARVMSLSQAGQILLTRATFDSARQNLRSHPSASDQDPLPLRWMAHGGYLFHGAEEPVEIFEVGIEGEAPLREPPNNAKARRSVSAEEEQTLGWRPAIGLEIPDRHAWIVERKIGEGGFGEVWLGCHKKLSQRRVFKFCFDVDRLRTFKREITLFRLLREALGDRKDIARLHEIKLDKAPFFIESEYTEGGNLSDWALTQKGIDKVSLEVRLDLMARIADALAAAHSVGVLHKDIKPSNILIYSDEEGHPKPRLSDFGIGALTDPSRLQKLSITQTGFTVLSEDDSSRTGTRVYTPPEALIGRPFTVQGDIYALGVLLYQMVVGDLGRPVGEGWERNVADDLLRSDIALCIDEDLHRRLSSAKDLSQRIRTLEQRRKAQHQAQRHAHHAQLRRFLLRSSLIAAALLLLLLSAAAAMFFREKGLRRDADRLRVLAEISETNAREEQKRAEMQLAYSMVAEAEALGLAFRWPEARDRYEQSRQIFLRLGGSTLPAELGLWDAYQYSPVPLNRLRGHKARLQALVVLPDHRTILSASDDANVCMWDAPSGTLVRTFSGHIGPVYSLALLPDGQSFISAGADSTLKLWELKTGKLIRTFTGHKGVVPTVAVTSDGRRVISGAGDTTLIVWDVATAAILQTLRRHIDVVQSVVISPNDEFAISVSDDSTAIIWDLKEGKPLHRIAHPWILRAVAISPDGKEVITGCNDNIIRMFNVQTGAPIKTYVGHGGPIETVAFSPDARWILSASGDNTVRLWNRATGQLQCIFNHSTPVYCGVFAGDGSMAVSGCDDGSISVWPAYHGGGRERRGFFGQYAILNEVHFSSDCRLAVCASNNPDAIRLWDVANGRSLRSFTPHPSAAAVVLSPDMQWLASSGHDLNLRVWDTRTGELLKRIKAHGERAEHIVLARNAPLAVTASLDHTVKLWDTTDWKELRTIAAHSDQVRSVAVSADGKRILSGAYRSIKLWDSATGGLIRKLTGHSDTVYALAFSSDGSRALSGSGDRTLKLWDLNTGEVIRNFVGHQNDVRSISWSEDERYALSASSDKTLKLWEVQSGREIHTFRGHSNEIHAADLTPDATAAISAGWDGEISYWDFSRPATYRQFEPRLERARRALAENPNDAPSLCTLAQWYDFRRAGYWSIDLFEQARRIDKSAPVSSLTLARAYWRRGDIEPAIHEFELALQNKEAPSAYLALCIESLKRSIKQPKTAPASDAEKKD